MVWTIWTHSVFLQPHNQQEIESRFYLDHRVNFLVHRNGKTIKIDLSEKSPILVYFRIFKILSIDLDFLFIDVEILYAKFRLQDFEVYEQETKIYKQDIIL